MNRIFIDRIIFRRRKRNSTPTKWVKLIHFPLFCFGYSLFFHTLSPSLYLCLGKFFLIISHSFWWRCSRTYANLFKSSLVVVKNKIIEICLIVTNEPFNTYVNLTVKDCHKPHMCVWYFSQYYWTSIYFSFFFFFLRWWVCTHVFSIGCRHISLNFGRFYPYLESVFYVKFLGLSSQPTQARTKCRTTREHICEQLKVLNWLKLMLAAICSKETDFGCDKVDVQIKDSPCFTSE